MAMRLKLGTNSDLNITIKFEPRDMWIGLFWQYSKSVESPFRRVKFYICIVPMLPIIFDFALGWGLPSSTPSSED